eukprot:3786088-Amphidinium_carterae.1
MDCAPEQHKTPNSSRTADRTAESALCSIFQVFVAAYVIIGMECSTLLGDPKVGRRIVRDQDQCSRKRYFAWTRKSNLLYQPY